MALSDDAGAVEHQAALSRFVIANERGMAVLEYRREGQRLLALHTRVPEAQRGRGLAARLTAALLQFCRQQHLQLVPLCSYTAAYVQRHPAEAAGLLADS